MNILVTGGAGMLARALVAELQRRGHGVTSPPRASLDVTDPFAVSALLERLRPDIVVQCAAYTRVDDAEHEEPAALRVNADATRHIALACRDVGARFVYPSTDYVFDGTAATPYPTDASTSPLNAYGRTKLAGELAARAAGDFLIVRTSWLYGAGGRNFVAAMLGLGREGRPLRVVDDQRGSPTWTGSLAVILAGLLERLAPPGLYHATNAGETTWFGLASAALSLAGIDVPVEPVRSDAFPRPARRPAYSVLDCSRTETVVGPIAHWRDALAEAIRVGV